MDNYFFNNLFINNGCFKSCKFNLLPLYLNILEHLSIYEIFSTSNLFLLNKKNIILIGIIFLIAVLPLYGWDGINFSLWKDFFEDTCKYGLYCDNPFLR